MSHIPKRKHVEHDLTRVIFRLRRYLPKEDQDSLRKKVGYCSTLETTPLIEQFKNGLKDIEYRKATPFWLRRLTTIKNPQETNFDLFFPRWHGENDLADLTGVLKVKKAWLMEGYPKNNMPRLEGKIVGLWLSKSTNQLGIKIEILPADNDTLQLEDELDPAFVNPWKERANK